MSLAKRRERPATVGHIAHPSIDAAKAPPRPFDRDSEVSRLRGELSEARAEIRRLRRRLNPRDGGNDDQREREALRQIWRQTTAPVPPTSRPRARSLLDWLRAILGQGRA